MGDGKAAERVTGAETTTSRQWVRRSAVLHGRRSEKIDAAAALGSAGFTSGVALLASADAYRVARWDGRRLLVPAVGGETEAELPATGRGAVFEVRMFDGVAELRWVNRAAGFGRAVVLSEQSERVDGTLAKPLAPLVVVHSIDTSYLLWGSAAAEAGSVPKAWTRLLEARIGRLDVPLPSAETQLGDRVLLDTVEYVVTDDHGNAYVAEELLVGLRAVTAAEAVEVVERGGQAAP